MSSNRVTILVDAKDLASQTIRNLGDSITGSILKANLLAQALQLIGSAVGKIGDMINEAADQEMGAISSTGAVMGLLGDSYAQASQYIDEFSEKMARQAASLPGTTAEYVRLGKGIMDNVVMAFRDANGVVDREAMNASLENITTRAGLLANNAQVTAAMASRQIGKYLGGATEGEWSRWDFFELNPTLITFMEEQARKMGKELNDLTERERLEVLEKALEVITPKEVMEAASNSFQGVMETMKSNLFDPFVGLFGLLRDVEEGVENSNVLTEMTKTLQLLFGQDGTLSQLQEVLADMGIVFGDPMVAIRNALIFVNSKIDLLNEFLYDLGHGFASFGLTDGASGLSEVFNGAIQGLADFIGSLRIGQRLQSLNLGDLFNKSFDALVGYFQGIDMASFSNLGGSIGRAIGDGFSFIFDFIRDVDWSKVLPGLFQISFTIIEAIGSLVVGIAEGFASAIAGNGFSMGDLARFVWEMMSGLYVALDQLGWKLFDWMITGFIQIDKFGDWLGAQFFGWIGDGLIGVFKALVLNPLDSLGEAIGDGFNFLKDKWDDFWEGVMRLWDTITQPMSGVLNNVGNAAQTALSFVSPIGGAISGAWDAVTPNNAGGFFPGGIGSLLQSALRETSAMPSGANLVVANDSEMILNRSQQAGLGALLGGGSGGVNIGNIQILSNASDPIQVAQQVIQQLATEVSRARDSQLSPAYS